MHEIVERKVSELHELENNPRTISDGDFNVLRQSIKKNPEFFNARPLILSNRTGKLVIIAGNQKFKAAKANGRRKVPTVLIEGLTIDQEKEIIARDNISSGEWDMPKLLKDYDLKLLKDWGFKAPVLDKPNTRTVTYNLSNKFKLKIECETDSERQKLFSELQERGINVKIV